MSDQQQTTVQFIGQENEFYSPPKILMKDGKWLVPVWQRPRDWREREKPKQDTPNTRDVPVQARPRDERHPWRTKQGK